MHHKHFIFILYIARNLDGTFTSASANGQDPFYYITRDLSFVADKLHTLSILFHNIQTGIDKANDSILSDEDRLLLFNFQQPDTPQSWIFHGLPISLFYADIKLTFNDILRSYQGQIFEIQYVSKICLLYICISDLFYFTNDVLFYCMCTYIIRLLRLTIHCVCLKMAYLCISLI